MTIETLGRTAAVCLAAMMLSSCIPKDKSTNVNINPYLGEVDSYEIDFVELHNQTLEYFGDVVDSPYTFVTDVDISGSNVKDEIDIRTTVADMADREDAEHFAAAILRHIGEAAADQYPGLGAGNADSFGGVFDLYGIELSIEDTEGYEVYALSVPAGDDIPLDPDIESYEEEWLEFINIYIAGQKAENEAGLAEEDRPDALSAGETGEETSAGPEE